ncbi:hypothetical protein LSAT2_009858, partial [Lamellibrachia satsuma]
FSRRLAVTRKQLLQERLRTVSVANPSTPRRVVECCRRSGERQYMNRVDYSKLWRPLAGVP